MLTAFSKLKIGKIVFFNTLVRVFAQIYANTGQAAKRVKMWLGLRGGHEAWNEKKPKIRGSTGGASSVQGRRETVAQTDSGRSSAQRRLYLPACARHQFQLCPARLGGLWSSLLSWTSPSEHLWLSGVALDSPNIKPFLQEDRCRMPFFLLFLACLMSALVVRSDSCFFSWKVFMVK